MKIGLLVWEVATVTVIVFGDAVRILAAKLVFQD